MNFILTIPQLERALAAVEQRSRTSAIRLLDSILHEFGNFAYTQAESKFFDDLTIRAKSHLAAMPDSALDEVAAEMTEMLAWARAVDVRAVTGRLVGGGLS